MNSRFLPMGVALGPSLPGGPLWRAAQGQTVVDASWAIAGRGDGTFDRWLLFGSTAIQYVDLGRRAPPVGALGGNVLGDPTSSGSTRSTRRSSSRCSSGARRPPGAVRGGARRR